MTYTLADVCCCGGLASDGYAAVLGAGNVLGFDLYPQPDYPYPFARADAVGVPDDDLPLDLTPTMVGVLLDRDHPRYMPTLEYVDAVHVSLPCQAITTAGHLRTAQGGTSRFPDLLTPGLELLRRDWRNTAWIVENVDDNRGQARRIMAPRPGESLIMLCGSMFGLEVQRHRLFLANFPLRRPEPTGRGVYAQQGCRHDTFPPDPITGKPRPWGVWHVAGDNVPSGGRSARDAEHGRQVMGSHRSLPWETLKEGFPPAYASWVAADLVAHLSRVSPTIAV